MRRLRILTWHVHGNYLYYLSQIPHDIFLPVRADRSHGYAGCTSSFNWGNNVHEILDADVKNTKFDVIIYQAKHHYEQDQHDILSNHQRHLPRIYIEHDPPRGHPTNTPHTIQDPDTLLVHVTAFNQLMWDNGITTTKVIEHGVMIPPDVRYDGEIPRGIVVVNNMKSRGRRLGVDVFERAKTEVPLDLIGMNAVDMGGVGEIHPMELARFVSSYRFFFNPIRYTSLGLAVCEAMMVGMPIIALATTEMATVIDNGFNGFIDTCPNNLIITMKDLIADPGEAERLGRNARKTAHERFNISRFVHDWNEALSLVTGHKNQQINPVSIYV